jgi:S-adenosylmethionine:tRNA ribosyltransferase-isomerase
MESLDLYDFNLPPHLIATDALLDRSACRLMYLGQNSLKPTHDIFKNIGTYLRPTDVLVVNNTKVMKARIYAYDDAGKRIELLLARPLPNGRFSALIYARSARMVGGVLQLYAGDHAHQLKIVAEHANENGVYEIESDIDLAHYAASFGEIPVPPYFRRVAQESDDINYQTVYAKHLGAVAAPTAGLHFTEDLLKNLQDMGISVVETTLHVGPGTFLPIRSNNIENHRMHAEYFVMDETCAQALNRAKNNKQRIIAVGSTAMRVLEHVMLEAVANKQNGFFPCEGETSIFIRPGHQFLACDGIITNFHIPRSTLILLVSAVAGRERVFQAYHEAINLNYRFYSYGDACFFEVI